jgi:alcohol dehydrogenase (cytochrome c)
VILAELDVAGVKRKVAMQLNRNGFLYVLDRTNGQLISAKPFERVNWASGIDETGRPIETEIARKLRAGEQVELWPTQRGAKNWPHAAFNPDTGLLYANTMHAARLFRQLETKPFVVGQRFQFIENLPARQPEGEPIAHMDAIDPLTAKQTWRAPIADHPHWSAMLATGGGLLFTGKMTGEFIAVDAQNGKTLWQFQTGSGINAQPVTFTQNGRQYVTVLSGIGGVYRNQAGNELKNVPPGGSVWTFALMPE